MISEGECPFPVALSTQLCDSVHKQLRVFPRRQKANGGKEWKKVSQDCMLSTQAQLNSNNVSCSIRSDIVEAHCNIDEALCGQNVWQSGTID